MPRPICFRIPATRNLLREEQPSALLLLRLLVRFGSLLAGDYHDFVPFCLLPASTTLLPLVLRRASQPALLIEPSALTGRLGTLLRKEVPLERLVRL